MTSDHINDAMRVYERRVAGAQKELSSTRAQLDMALTRLTSMQVRRQNTQSSHARRLLQVTLLSPTETLVPGLPIEGSGLPSMCDLLMRIHKQQPAPSACLFFIAGGL